MKRLLIIITILFIAFPTHAEVFKCEDPVRKRVRYQSTPCVDAPVSTTIAIEKRSAKEEAIAERDRAVWEARYRAEQEAKAIRRQAVYEQRLREAEVAAQFDQAGAQRAQAVAQFQQAEELRRKNELRNRSLLFRHNPVFRDRRGYR